MYLSHARTALNLSLIDLHFDSNQQNAHSNQYQSIGK